MQLYSRLSSHETSTAGKIPGTVKPIKFRDLGVELRGLMERSHIIGEVAGRWRRAVISRRDDHILTSKLYTCHSTL